jgi:hypothetical protein
MSILILLVKRTTLPPQKEPEALQPKKIENGQRTSVPPGMRMEPIPPKKEPISPVQKSAALAAILANVPESVENDPLLTPLRHTYESLKDLTWLDVGQQAFDVKEQKMSSKALEELGKRQEAHSIRQSMLYASNHWEQAEEESKSFDEEEQRQKEIEMRQYLTRWRKEFCNISYDKLHTKIDALADLHKDITHLETCENVEEQIRLLNDTQTLFIQVMRKLDVLTDDLRRQQYELKFQSAQMSDDWNNLNKIDNDKAEEDKALKDRRTEFKLERVRLHASCITFIVESKIGMLRDLETVLAGELQKIMGKLSDKARSDLPVDYTADSLPSDELVDQFREASTQLDSLNQRISSLYTLLVQNDSELVTEETAPAIADASASDKTAGKKLRDAQTSKIKDIQEANITRQKDQDTQTTAFADHLQLYIMAHDGRKEETARRR